MKKIIALSMVSSLALASTAFASSAPVTDITAGQLKVNVEYSHNRVKEVPVNINGYNTAVQYGFTNHVVGQASYTHHKIGEMNLNKVEFNGVYNVADHVNVYAGVSRYSNTIGNHKSGLEAGVIGYMPVGDKTEVFAKIGFSNNIVKRNFQLGASYALTENIDVHAYYEHNRFDIKNEVKFNTNGYSIGIGYKF